MQNKITPQPFEDNNLYYQWLVRRQAWPMKTDLRSMRIIWWITIACLIWLVTITPSIFNMGSGMMWMPLWIQVVLGWSLGFLITIYPIAIVFLDCLAHIPRTIRDDTVSHFMTHFYLTPIETTAILRDIRRWAFRLIMRHLAPSLTLMVVVGFFIISQTMSYASTSDFYRILFLVIIPVILAIIFFVRFLYATGLASIGMPWIFTSTGMSIVLWVIPVSFLINYFAYRLLENIIFQDLFNTAHNYRYSNYDELIVTVYCVLIIIAYEIFTQLLLFLAPKILNKKRLGTWG